MENLLLGLSSFGAAPVWFGLLGGALIGYFIGAIPGLGPSLGIALLIPFTYGMDPVVAIVTLVALYVAAEYGGAISAVLINSPGTVSAVPTSWDGYPMTLQGKAGMALNISIMASGIGILLSAVLLALTAVPLAELALILGPAEYFALALLGLTFTAGLSQGSALKGAVAMGLGLALATVGLDGQSGLPRFAPSYQFFEGLPLVPVLLGLYAISEVFVLVEKRAEPQRQATEIRGLLAVPLKSYDALKGTILRSSLLGYVIGVLPGAGPAIASFISYAVARRLSPSPERFGEGAPEGVAASEAANNAAVSGVMAPTLALGIPGSATSAILIGALTIHGLQPGPLLFSQSPEIPYTIFVSLFLGVPVMVLFGLFGARLWARLANVPRPIVAAGVAVICLAGSYATKSSMFPVYVTLAFGVIGYLFRKTGIPLAPIVLALVLGEMIETNFRRAVVISGGDYWIFLQNPVSAVLLAIAAAAFLVPAAKALFGPRKANGHAPG
ncbi:tripartite tricarboxylate transporter permease [Mangrovicoccus ximenensis]|uniref:tripartite tricarboxylate transporter permease n=1 Tax=Mangrovicoccus ximenensis TaxID=1911570 RepID=UPI000D3769EA|nr:tripartite tricarboxylate transporter permease [Mangrovicoccus ximenensis]